MAEERPIAFPDKEPTVPTPDQKAVTEEAGIAKGVDLSNQRSLSELARMVRRGQMDAHIHNVTCVAVYLIGAALIICVLIIIASYVLPRGVNPFDTEQIAKLREFISTGVLGAGFNEARRRISKETPD